MSAALCDTTQEDISIIRDNINELRQTELRSIYGTGHPNEAALTEFLGNAPRDSLCEVLERLAIKNQWSRLDIEVRKSERVS